MLISLVEPGASLSWPQGHYLKKLGRGPLGDATYQYQGCKHYGFRQEDFFYVFPYIGLCKTCDPWGGAVSGPRDIIRTNLVEVY